MFITLSSLTSSAYCDDAFYRHFTDVIQRPVTKLSRCPKRPISWTTLYLTQIINEHIIIYSRPNIFYYDLGFCSFLALRSKEKVLSLVVPKTRTFTYGDRSLMTIAPKLWNSFPVSVRDSKTLGSFNRSLKTFFKSTYVPSNLEFKVSFG